ncbi:hypothetical protein T440DRAFT_554651 [Plenodomus tracheiphilus IPT5]|uniref:Rhodopsin domain-containing protein n=1 Tax=Plenodomus tracheiphilus IPT5 TaxID=1408161 RepID=A0A6A7B611_9PLEO|nr:hypothetical protein T440DRAFT_554651 [Plenodomus tracheiphilus IPT5]
METATSKNLPWDTSVGNRFAHQGPDNHSGPLWIAAILGMIYMVAVLILRLYIKRRVLGYNDYLIIASSVAAFGQYVAVYYALSCGLGKTLLQVHDTVVLGRVVFSTRVLYITSICLAKLSVLAIVYSIFCQDNKFFKFPCYVAMGGTVIFGVVSVFTVTLGCPSAGLFTSPHCRNQVVRWNIVTALDICTEVAILLLVPYMVWQLHMPAKKKIHVIMAFSTRASVIPISTMYLVSWRGYTDSAPSPLSFTRVMIWQQVLLSLSVISATLPSLKAFLESLSARWNELDATVYGSYGTRAGAMELSEMNHSRPKTTDLKITVQKQFETRIDTSAQEAGERASRASTSGGSQDLIIRKEATWNVIKA